MNMAEIRPARGQWVDRGSPLVTQVEQFDAPVDRMPENQFHIVEMGLAQVDRKKTLQMGQMVNEMVAPSAIMHGAPAEFG